MCRPLDSTPFDPWRGNRLQIEVLDRMPPHDLLAERSVLGSLMVGWRSCESARVIGMLSTYDFHGWQYGRLFMQIRRRLHGWQVFGGAEALAVAKAADMHIADVAEAIYDADCRRLMEQAKRLTALRVVRERIFAAIELLRMAWSVGQWDDATERGWYESATRLLENLKP